MSQPKDWLYFLTDEQGRSYRVNNGIVEAVSTPTPLQITPDGWQDKSIKYARNISTSGLWRTFTNPLKYVKQAALIVRTILYTIGTEAKLFQVIHRLDKSFLGEWVHRFFYMGELDLTQADDDDTDITVNIMEGDLSKLFKANESTQYEIPIDVPEAITVQMDGLELKASSKWTIQVPGASVGPHLPGTLFINTEGTQFDTETQTVFLQASPDLNTSDQYFFKNNSDADIIVSLKGFLKVRADVSAPFGLDVQENDSVLSAALYLNPAMPADEEVTINFDVTYTLPAGAHSFLVANYIADFLVRIHYLDGEINISYKSKYKTTYIKALRPAYVAQKLLDKITGGGYLFTSSYLTTEWENLLVTCGDAVRKIDGPKLKISWRDFSDSYHVPTNICEGIRNQQLFIEKRADAFQPYIQMNLGQVRSMKPSTRDAKEFQYNVVKIGYPNTSTEDVNGKDEFNVTQTYSSPIKRVSKTLDLVSKIIASMYEIEITRINLDGKTTTDDNNDNNSFFLHVEKTATAGTGDEPATYYKLLRNAYDSITGLISPSTAFNLELHPELCLRRHGNFMRSIFYWQEAGYLVRETSDKNADVVVIKAGATYIGNKNTRIGSLDAPLFVPIVFKVEGPMPSDTIEVMDTGPDGTFSFMYDGFTHYGFPMEVGIQPANRPAQETTLLCSPQTILPNLITISR
jgi:hypothetical protein